MFGERLFEYFGGGAIRFEAALGQGFVGDQVADRVVGDGDDGGGGKGTEFAEAGGVLAEEFAGEADEGEVAGAQGENFGVVRLVFFATGVGRAVVAGGEAPGLTVAGDRAGCYGCELREGGVDDFAEGAAHCARVLFADVNADAGVDVGGAGQGEEGGVGGVVFFEVILHIADVVGGDRQALGAEGDRVAAVVDEEGGEVVVRAAHGQDHYGGVVVAGVLAVGVFPFVCADVVGADDAAVVGQVGSRRPGDFEGAGSDVGVGVDDELDQALFDFHPALVVDLREVGAVGAQGRGGGVGVNSGEGDRLGDQVGARGDSGADPFYEVARVADDVAGDQGPGVFVVAADERFGAQGVADGIGTPFARAVPGQVDAEGRGNVCGGNADL